MGLLTLTDRRLLFTKDGRMASTSEDFPLERVSSVQWSSGMLSGKITIFASGNKAELKAVEKNGGKSLVDHVRDRISTGPTVSPSPPAPVNQPNAPSDDSEQLRKLADLHAAGILTDEEFTAKKAEILDRM